MVASSSLGTAIIEYAVFFKIQNKREYQPIKSWRGDPMDSQMGQFLFYLVVSQIRAITAFPYPAPRVWDFHGRWACKFSPLLKVSMKLLSTPS